MLIDTAETDEENRYASIRDTQSVVSDDKEQESEHKLFK